MYMQEHTNNCFSTLKNILWFFFRKYSVSIVYDFMLRACINIIFKWYIYIYTYFIIYVFFSSSFFLFFSNYIYCTNKLQSVLLLLVLKNRNVMDAQTWNLEHILHSKYNYTIRTLSIPNRKSWGTKMSSECWVNIRSTF